MKDANEYETINVRFKIQDSELHIRVQDWGGGFDIKKLPYDLKVQ